MAIVAILLFMAIVGAMVVGGIILVVRRFAKVTTERSDAWQRLAREYGLRFSKPDLNLNTPGMLTGVVDGMVTTVRSFAYSESPGTHWRTIVTGVRVSTQTWPPLDVGLIVRPSRRTGVYAFGFHVHEFVRDDDMKIVDPMLDRALELYGDEPERVAALFTPELRTTLQRLVGAGDLVELVDGGLSLERRLNLADEAAIRAALRDALAATAVFDRARAAVPPAAPLVPVREQWRAFASQNGLQGLDAPLSLWGTYEGIRFRATAVRMGVRSFGLELSVSYPAPLGIGLFVRRSKSQDSMSLLVASRDRQLRDPAFDSTFDVQAWVDDATLARVLDPQVRADALGLLGWVGSLQIRDDGVALRAPSLALDLGHLGRLARAAQGLALRIFRNAGRDGKSLGPYRAHAPGLPSS